MIYEDGGRVFVCGEMCFHNIQKDFHRTQTHDQIGGQKNTLKFIDFCLDNGEYLNSFFPIPQFS